MKIYAILSSQLGNSKFESKNTAEQGSNFVAFRRCLEGTG